MRIRTAEPGDAASLAELWTAAGLKLRPGQVTAELAAVLARDPDLVLIAEDADGLTAAVLGTFDGRRGWVNRLATRPGRRGQGHASAVLAELERRLGAKGCRKVNLLIEPDNKPVTRFLPAARIHRGPADLHGEVAATRHRQRAGQPRSRDLRPYERSGRPPAGRGQRAQLRVCRYLSGEGRAYRLRPARRRGAA